MQRLKLDAQTDLNISKNIQKQRKNAKMTQEQVAARLQLMNLSINRSYYSQIELGLLNVPISMLVALKLIFQCEYADFFEGLEEQLTQSISKAEQDDA